MKILEWLLRYVWNVYVEMWILKTPSLNWVTKRKREKQLYDLFRLWSPGQFKVTPHTNYYYSADFQLEFEKHSSCKK